MKSLTNTLKAAAALMAATTLALTAATAPSAQVIASVYIEAGGCQSTARSYSIDIPAYRDLDTSYPGTVAGIEFRETTHVGRAGYRNVSFESGHLKFDLFSDGGGATQYIPFRGNVCVGATGASIGYQIVAHYK
jgi:hypothetical protein